MHLMNSWVASLSINVSLAIFLFVVVYSYLLCWSNKDVILALIVEIM
jgi:hypothetical protein